MYSPPLLSIPAPDSRYSQAGIFNNNSSGTSDKSDKLGGRYDVLEVYDSIATGISMVLDL